MTCKNICDRESASLKGDDWTLEATSQIKNVVWTIDKKMYGRIASDCFCLGERLSKQAMSGEWVMFPHVFDAYDKKNVEQKDDCPGTDQKTKK